MTMMRRMMAVVGAAVLTLCGLAVANQQGIGWHFDMMRNGSLSYGPSTPTGFITTWVVTNGGSITLPLRSGYTYNMTVDYGDGTVVNVNSNSDPDATHQFTTGDSNRTVTITGTMGAWYFNNAGSKANFRYVSNWEPISGLAAAGMPNAFYGCNTGHWPNSVLGPSYTNVTTLSATWLSCSGNTNVFPAVSNLTKVASLQGTWYNCSGIKNGFPEVNALTNVNTLYQTWSNCSGNTNAFPAVSNLTKVTTLADTWYNCSGIKNGFPEVNALTNVTSLNQTWRGCSGNTNAFPAVSNLTKVTTLQNTWNSCSGNTNAFPAVSNLTNVTSLQNTWSGCNASYFSVQSVLGDCLWITGQVNNVSSAFYNNYRMTGQGMPLVTAITNSPGYPTGYTTASCFYNCTNLSDYASIPAGFK